MLNRTARRRIDALAKEQPQDPIEFLRQVLKVVGLRFPAFDATIVVAQRDGDQVLHSSTAPRSRNILALRAMADHLEAKEKAGGESRS